MSVTFKYKEIHIKLREENIDACKVLESNDYDLPWFAASAKFHPG